MRDVDNTFRLAIGIFYEASQLERVVENLRADGFTAPTMCLIGTPAALELVKQRAACAPATGGIAALDWTEVQKLDCRTEQIEFVATPGPLIRTLLQTKNVGRPLSGNWLQEELCDRLVGHVRKGAVALLVSVRSAVSQQRCSRILLRHSLHAVQTHEFTLAPSEPV